MTQETLPGLPARRIKTFPDLILRHALDRRCADDPLLSRPGMFFYSSARAAILQGARWLGMPAGSEVLVPAYNCGVEAEAVIRAGAQARFYRIREDMTVDEDDLLRRVTPATRAVMVIHYFGFPQQLSRILQACRQRSLALIEDCAHALYSRSPDGQWLGTSGDFGAYSIQKTVFLPNGGGLLLNRWPGPAPRRGRPHFDLDMIKAAVRSSLDHETAAGSALGRALRPLAARLERRGHAHEFSAPPAEPVPPGTATAVDSAAGGGATGGAAPRGGATGGLGADGTAPGPPVPSYYDVPRFGYEHGMSRLSRFLLRREPSGEIVRRRRAHYATLLQLLEPIDEVTAVFPQLPQGVCPLGLPVYIDRAGGARGELEKRLKAAGVDVYVFGRRPHPRTPLVEFPELARLSHGVLCLPVHQHLERGDLEAIAGAVRGAVAACRHSR